MICNYGYADASGNFYITVDTDKCNGCGDCVKACPQNVLTVEEDDYGDEVVMVKEDIKSKLSYVCLGYESVCKNNESNCHSACPFGVITHTW